MKISRRPGTARLFWAVAGTCAVIAVVLVVLAAINHEGFGSERLRHLGLPLVGVLLALCAAALYAWRRQVRDLLTGFDEQAEEARRAAQETEAQLEHERRELARAREMRRTEEEWARTLRSEVAEAHRELGSLGSGDPHTLVLRIAMQLLDA